MTEMYDPEKFLQSTFRTLKDYVEDNLNTRVFSVIMEFPGSIFDAGEMPLNKTTIHFALDDDDAKPVGFGSGEFASNYDSDNGNFPQYAAVHMLTLDVGVWASDESGGTTSRMRAKEYLHRMFDINNGGSKQLQDFSDNGDGRVEVLSFSGGRFVLDSANDVRLYRMVDCQLMVRVYSRTPLPTVAVPTIEEIDQAPNLTIIG